MWSHQLIGALWAYSRGIWSFRNTTIHGKDIKEKRLKDKEKLYGQVTALFDLYSTDPHFITQAMNHLFNKPIQYILAMDRDAIASWIKLVEEATQIKVHTEHTSKDSILQFLRPRVCTQPAPTDSNIADPNPYHPAQHSLSLPAQTSNNEPRMVPLHTATRTSHESDKSANQMPHKSRHQRLTSNRITSIPTRQRQKRKTRRPSGTLQATILSYTKGPIGRRQADSDSIHRDYSGTYVSTAP